MIGLDVGSTTAKAVVVDVAQDQILWQDYQRHETQQAEKVLEFLEAIETAFPDVPRSAIRLFVTGSGGAALVKHIGGKFVQEVNAVSLAVEKFHPEVQSVIELGGQDAKIIIFKEISDGRKKKIPSMNDKCAGGTGAVIDKINAKLKIAPAKLPDMRYTGIAVHPVAGKCGVFAETDINSLQKQGVPPEQLMASLFESIVQQNLSVLTRGHTLRPTVLLLGGPNTFIKGMRECWQHNIPIMWEERGVALPDPNNKPEDYIITPENAEYFASIGAVEFGKTEVDDNPGVGHYLGYAQLRQYIEHDRAAMKVTAGMQGLANSPEELAAFKAQYRMEAWQPAHFNRGKVIEAFIGIDGGSTSTKGVLLGKDQHVLAKAYMLSNGNPIEDTMEIIARLEQQVIAQGADLMVLGVGTTGYAKDMLKDVLKADVALVETAAHTEACLHYYPGTDVIVDVGGQDIKLIILKDGRVKDFKLNTQCSAGNGYFLQSTAQNFGYDIDAFADIAFKAKTMPEFGYGCAVFMQSDIVDFQRQGWEASEIMAGLAAVLPKNIWLYVAQIPNLAQLGRKFVLQGGTQRNLAAVKAQVDFIRTRFKGTEIEPEVIVHTHCGESGAIGCAIEAHRLWAEQGRVTEFIGLTQVQQISYITTHSEDTRCQFCKNQCVRTFIDVKTGAHTPMKTNVDRFSHPHDTAPKEDKQRNKLQSKVPLAPDHQRLIIASCEKGTVEDLAHMRRIKASLDEIIKENPNFIGIGSKAVFREVDISDVADPLPKVHLLNVFHRNKRQQRRALMQHRKKVRIGMPRVLNMYAYAPFFIGYFTSLGVPYRNLVFSNYTDQDLYKRGAKRGSIDPCYPSKLAIPHVHDLLYRHHSKKPLTYIFFPMVDSFPTYLDNVVASRACPTLVATVEATHAAFTKEGDLFKQKEIVFKKTFLDLDEPQLCARQMHQDWKDELGLSAEESYRAVCAGLTALEDCYKQLCSRSREVLDEIERENRIGIVVLGRPYHNDPGVNHEVLDELQKQGYPIFWQDTLPRDPDILERLFGDEVRAGIIDSPLSINDAWKNSYSEHTSRKVWAAKYAARHPNLVALELSSFKCGHDAPIYTVMEEIIENSGTPYFCFKDIDENKPAGSIKIRTETITYFLSRYRERLIAEQEKRAEIEQKLQQYEMGLRANWQANIAGAQEMK
jgi:predicted CoA-substrate-specific enzyme activase